MRVVIKSILDIAADMGVLNSDSNCGKRNTIKLPAIQRGFVWKPYQIENIWDSIFRKYPIGSFLLADNGENLELFDGQQRATAIALGFYNPWDSDQPSKIGNAKSLPTIWVDLDPMETNGDSRTPILSENSLRLFRVLTESHPWGYKAKSNIEKLSASHRAEAWEQIQKAYNIYNYTQLKASQRLPYSSRVPVPLCFLFKAFLSNRGSTPEYFKHNVITLIKKNLSVVDEYYRPFYLQNNLTYFEALESLSLEIWEEWFKDLGQILDESTYCVPLIVLDKEVLTPHKVAEVSSSDDPTLFVRLNAGGTALAGDELMYSIFKSFFPIGKDVEKTDIAQFISPSRIIVLLARLLLRESIDRNSSFPEKINSRRFQAVITSNTSSNSDNSSLGDRMAAFIDKDMEPLFKNAINILKNNDSVPDVVVKSFIRNSSSGFLLLLNYLLHCKQKPDAEIRNAICRKLYRNYFFGNLDRLASFQYPDKTTVWGRSIEQVFWLDDSNGDMCNLIQIPLICPNRLLTFYIDRIEKAKNESWSYQTRLDSEKDNDIISLFAPSVKDSELPDQLINEAWDTFLWRLKNLDSRGKGLVLLAQKDFIENRFPDYNQLKDLEDTNTPWDWDHIYPYSWMRGQSSFVYYWGNSLGNFRAMSLVDNRSENNNYSPEKRYRERLKCYNTFDPFCKDYFIDQKIDGHEKTDLEYWLKLGDKYAIQSNRDPMLSENLAYAVAYRTVSIYQNFYKLFVLDSNTQSSSSPSR